MSKFISDIAVCDDALMDKLEGLEVEGENGDIVKVPVIYVSPEGEFKVESYPTIVVYRAGTYPDNTRWHNDTFYDNEVRNGLGELESVDRRTAPVPWNIYYGIRLYYEYHEDGVALNNHIYKKLPRGAYVDILGEKYDLDYVSYKNPSATYKDFGAIPTNKKREFVEQFLYKMRIELDFGERKTVKVNTQGVQVNSTIKGG